MSDHPFGRRIPPDFEHVAKYPLRALAEIAVPSTGVEKSLGLPWWWKQHDQGQEGACVGFGCSAMTSITNHRQRLLATGQDLTHRYASRWLYLEAQLIDEWTETPPMEGTSVRAACEILRARGHKRVQKGAVGPENLANGISAYRWAVDHQDMRAALYNDLAVAIGVNWYASFNAPYTWKKERWIHIGSASPIVGGHCLCVYRMSDRLQAFKLMNSWGAYYPSTWISYDNMDRLLLEQGEACVVTDR